MKKVRIILDADVLIHFSKAGMLSMLPEILHEYDHTISSTVSGEVISIQGQIDNQIHLLRNMSLLTFADLNMKDDEMSGVMNQGTSSMPFKAKRM